MKLKEKNQQGTDAVAETFYLYSEQPQPKKKRSLLPLWILVALIWAATIFLSFPRAQNFAMEKILPPDVHYRILEQRYVNNVKQNSTVLPSEFVFSLSGTADSDLLNDFPEKAYSIETPVDFSALPESKWILDSSGGTVLRSDDEGNIVFTVIFSEDSRLYGTEMNVTADADGNIIKRAFTAGNVKIEWQEISESGRLDYSFRYEKSEEVFSLSVSGSETENGYTGTGTIEYLGSTADISFENVRFRGDLGGTFKLAPKSGSDVSAEMTLSGTPEKPSAEVSFSDCGETLISYTISSENTENPTELTFMQISDTLKKLTAVEEFSPDELHEEPVHSCVRSVDLTMSKIKIGKKYIGLPAVLENLPELFELEGEIIESGEEKLFVTDNREVAIRLKNYNNKTDDAMKCDVTQIIVNGYAGKELWELKLNEIGIGSTQSQTVSVLGEPSRIETMDGAEIYCYHDCENEIEFRFKYKNGIINQIIFAV